MAPQILESDKLKKKKKQEEDDQENESVAPQELILESFMDGYLKSSFMMNHVVQSTNLKLGF